MGESWLALVMGGLSGGNVMAAIAVYGKDQDLARFWVRGTLEGGGCR